MQGRAGPYHPPKDFCGVAWALDKHIPARGHGRSSPAPGSSGTLLLKGARIATGAAPSGGCPQTYFSERTASERAECG
jgi:hypothetical protein